MQTSPAATKFIVIGKLVGIYGIKGWLKIMSFTDPLENIFSYQPWYLKSANGNFKETTLVDAKKHGKGLIVKFQDIDTPETARTLLGLEIAIDRAQLPELPENEYYWSDLQGMTVINQANITLGKVIEILATGANDVLIVQGEKRHLIPLLFDKTILTIDKTKKIISVDWDDDFL